jgi:uncharacterized membrane protein SpoIIM required for sporulation
MLGILQMEVKTIKLKTFIQQNRSDWEQLENKLRELKKRKVSPDRIDQFQLLYRKAAHHLSFAQTYFPNEDVTAYLNELVAKAHNTFYRNQTTSLYQLKTFFGTTFVKLLAEQQRFVLFAMLLFTIGMVGSFLSVLDDPLHLYSILPGDISLAVDPEMVGEGLDGINSPMMSAMIMTNNIQVSFLAFAGGLTLGIGTIYLLIYNGIIVGALAALFMQHDMTYEFWAYIVPHGMIELTAIFIAGGAGLMMGYHFIVPGRYPRIFQLKRQTIRSVQLLLGTLPLFILAGIIEGFLTPAPISLEAKYAIAFATVVGLILYVWLGQLLHNKHPKTRIPVESS